MRMTGAIEVLHDLAKDMYIFKYAHTYQMYSYILGLYNPKLRNDPNDPEKSSMLGLIRMGGRISTI